MSIVFEVPGEPRGKGRPRFSGGHVHTDSETRSYEKKIAAYYRKAHGAFCLPEKASVMVDVTAHYPIPKSATKADKARMEALMILPTRKPDIDNVIKAVLDALNGVAYKDDSRVVAVYGRKVYSHDPKLVIELKGW